MKKKNIIIIVSIIIIVLAIGGFTYISKVHSTDAYQFKKEYESLNGKNRESDGKKIRSITIENKNPMKYATAKEIVSKIDKKETFVVYFGFAECPWCRSVIGNLIEAANNKNIDTIYYVDIQNIRDIKEVENGEVKTTKEGNKAYLQLLEKLDNVLGEYIIEDEDGKEVDTEEKRIYAPNIVAVVNGKAEDLEEGISKKQVDPYMKLTKEMNQESIKTFECLFKCLEKANVCTQKTSC